MADEHTLHPHRTESDSNSTSRERLGAAASAVADDVRDFGHVAAEEGRAAMRRGAQAGEEALDSARLELECQRESLEDFVRQKPMRSLAYAAATGFALSLILRR